MAKIDFGKVVGENGTGGGSGALEIGKKVIPVPADSNTWLRKIGTNLVELQFGYMSTLDTTLPVGSGINGSWVTLSFYIPIGLRPMEDIWTTSSLYLKIGNDLRTSPTKLRIGSNGSFLVYNYSQYSGVFSGLFLHEIYPIA